MNKVLDALAIVIVCVAVGGALALDYKHVAPFYVLIMCIVFVVWRIVR